MPARRSPPILPRLNPLTAGHGAGRKPPMPYKFAVQRMRERQRLAEGMKQIAAIGGAVGPSKRLDILATRTAVAPSRSRQRTGIVRQAQGQAVRQERQAEEVAAPQTRSLRPPTRPETGRYARLKDGYPV